MARPKKSSTAAGATSSLLGVLSALTPPSGVFGDARARGLGANATVEAFLGCGFPRIVIGVDAPATPRDVAAFTKRYPHGTLPGVMPREDIARLYRLRTTGLGPEEQTAALGEDAALERVGDELTRLFSVGVGGSLPLWLLEALFDADTVLGAAIAFMGSHEPETWMHEPRTTSLVRALGTMLLRVTPAAHAQYVGALDGLFTRLDARSKAAKALDVILHGRAGVERSGDGHGGRAFLAEYAWAGDDPAWVTERVLARLSTLRPADREYFDPQVVVAGGVALIDAFRTSADKFQAVFRKDMAAYATLFR